MSERERKEVGERRYSVSGRRVKGGARKREGCAEPGYYNVK